MLSNQRYSQRKDFILKVVIVRNLVASKSIVNAFRMELLALVFVFVRAVKIVKIGEIKMKTLKPIMNKMMWKWKLSPTLKVIRKILIVRAYQLYLVNRGAHLIRKEKISKIKKTPEMKKEEETKNRLKNIRSAKVIMPRIIKVTVNKRVNKVQSLLEVRSSDNNKGTRNELNQLRSIYSYSYEINLIYI